MKNFWRNEKNVTEKFKTDMTKNSIDMFVKNEFIDDEKIEMDVLKKFCENIKFVDDNYEVSLLLLQEMKW